MELCAIAFELQPAEQGTLLCQQGGRPNPLDASGNGWRGI